MYQHLPGWFPPFRRVPHVPSGPIRHAIADDAGATNKHRYILATQSTALLTSLSLIPGLPIVHFNPRGVLVLSPPSTATVRVKNEAEEGRRLDGAKALQGLDEGDNVLGGGAGAGVGEEIPLDKKPQGMGLGKRRVKGPNPLSVKKRKTASSGAPRTGEAGAEADAPMDGKDKPAAKGEAGAGGDGDGDGRKSKKKRKRKNKSEVARVIGELNATNAGDGAAGGRGEDSD